MDASLRTLDTAYGGYYNLATTGGTTTLTLAQASNQVIIITGTLSSNAVVTFPAIAGRRIIIPALNLNGFALWVRGAGDPIGVYFWSSFGVPYGIVVTPNRVYWDYGALDAGTVVDKINGFAGNGWLPCDGRYVGMQQHDILWDIIGGTYGVIGTFPTGQFRLPDLRGTVTAMADQIGTIPATGPFAQNLGNRGILNSWGVNTFAGEANHILSVAELASHVHPDPGHAHGISDPGHVHSGVIVPGGGTFFPGVPSGAPMQGGNTAAAGTGIGIAVSGANLGAAGGNAAHNNVQPTTTTMKMIKW